MVYSLQFILFNFFLFSMLLYFNDHFNTLAVKISNSQSRDQSTPSNFHPNTNKSSKITSVLKRGSKGGKIKVKLPKGDQILQKEGKHTPNEYYFMEQRIVRHANELIKKGEVKGKSNAIRIAHDYIKQKTVKDHQVRKSKQTEKRIFKPRPTGYNTRINWTNRRAEGLLQQHDNGIDDRDEALQIANQLWIERIKSSNDKRAMKKKIAKEQKQEKTSGEDS